MRRAGQAAAARADRRRSVRPAGGLAGACARSPQREGLFTLDDLAQSFGCTLHGRPLGAAADATATSFFPSKPLGGYGDGGALFTESDERAALYRSLRTHGEGTSRYEVLHTGMNGRLDSMQAAVLLAKLTVFAEELAARERVARYYDSRLGNAVVTPARVPDSTSAWAIYAILLRDGGDAPACAGTLRADGVPTAIYYPRPLHLQPAYRDHHDGDASAGVGGSGGAHSCPADPSVSQRGRHGACVRPRACRGELTVGGGQRVGVTADGRAVAHDRFTVSLSLSSYGSSR